jgi:biopolymer transport protein ExbD
MKFSNRKRRQPPAIIIISLIDILIVLLIFLMVTTTFKQQPALKLVLPESKQAKQGASDSSHSLVVTIAKQEPFFHLGRYPITSDRLQQELSASVAKDPELSLSVQADADAPLGKVLRVSDAAKAAGIKIVHLLTKPGGKQ